MGQGPMTGRGAGFCAGFGVPGFMNVGRGGGFGRGFGRGGGFGRGFGRGMGFGRGGGFGRSMGFGRGYAGWDTMEAGAGIMPGAPTEAQERDILNKQVEYLEENLQEIRKRLAEIDAKKDSKS